MCAADELEKAKAEVLRQIAEHWQPKWKSGHVSILLKIDTNGKVFTALVCKTSGNKLLDDQALSVINGIQFQQLPEWLNLKVDLYCSRQPGLKMISTAQNSSSADGIVFIRWLDSAPLEAEQTQQSPVSGQDQQTMATRVAQRSLAIEEAKRRRQVAEQQRWRQATEQEQRSSAGRTYRSTRTNHRLP